MVYLKVHTWSAHLQINVIPFTTKATTSNNLVLIDLQVGSAPTAPPQEKATIV